MVPAVEKEIRIAVSIENLLEGLSYVHNPMGTLLKIQRFFIVSEKAKEILSSQYYIDASEVGRYGQILKEIRNILRVKAGEGGVNVAGQPRELMLPFWRFQITYYTFTTGSLFWKKGRAITDEVLILATVPFATKPITDIFKMKPKGGMLDGFLGKEASMTTGYIMELMKRVRSSSLSSRVRVIPPIITVDEAKLISDWYIGSVARATSGKVKFGVSKPMGLVYMGAELRKGDVYVPDLGDFQVSVGRHIDVLTEVAF